MVAQGAEIVLKRGPRPFLTKPAYQASRRLS